MGSSGSGRWVPWNSKITAESLYAIDIRWMKNNGLLIPGTIGSMSWDCQEKQIGSIGYRIEEDRLILVYRNKYMDGEWERIEDSIFFTWTSCNYGGERQWFLCPECNRRVALVYGGKYYRCRHCHNLTYASQQENISDRLMRRSRKIRKRMGGGNNLLEPFPCKPKNIHWNIYWRLRTEAERTSTRSLLISAKQLGIKL